jgi:hypothetical protein
MTIADILFKYKRILEYFSCIKTYIDKNVYKYVHKDSF